MGEIAVRGASVEVENVLTAHPAVQEAVVARPDEVHFCDLPKTSTGKIQKTVLRRRAAG
ncbi:hypothetical protein AB0K18_24180 [Nonomuraea sp. NPDC049421]|uniref:hypothetical protein n=1 Tax=Nonomuraea sp. NPDC049421 TaxID=3155275 RepID=UPI0034309F62